MSDFTKSDAQTLLITNYQIRRNFLYLLSATFSALTAINRHHIKLKPWAGGYIVSFWFLYIFITCLASFEDGNLSLPHWLEITLMAVWIVYAIIRIPLFFMVLSKETNFWRGGGASIDDSAIGEVQKLLDENRSILIDYMKLSFRKGEDEDKPDERLDTLARTRTRNRQRVLGTGATAKVVAAVYVLYCSSFHCLLIPHRLEYYKHRYKPSRRDTEIRKDLGKKRIGVAVKVFTPESITAQLLHVFAKEIELMRKLRHRT